jgi:hypothetical protein
MNKKLLGWVFAPSKEDRAMKWDAPANYVHAQVGEIRLKPESDTPMNNTMFEPGWKRFEDADCYVAGDKITLDEGDQEESIQ